MSWRVHRAYALLGLLCAVLAGVPLILAVAVPDPRALAGSYMGWALGIYLAGFTGAMLAAATFARGDVQRPAWALMAGSYLILVPMRLAAGPSPAGLLDGADGAPMVRVVASTLSSAMLLVGFLLLARAWRDSGLDDTRAWVRNTTTLLGVTVAVALVGYDVVAVQLRPALGGDLLAWGNIVTDLLDGAVFAVAVPVLRAAVALGGGLVAWPWVFLTASLLGWLGFDAIAASDGLGLAAAPARVATEVLRTWACLFGMAAGSAQRWIMSAPPDSASELEGAGTGTSAVPARSGAMGLGPEA